MAVMDIGDIPIFAMLRSRLGYLSERQRVIAENTLYKPGPVILSHASR